MNPCALSNNQCTQQPPFLSPLSTCTRTHTFLSAPLPHPPPPWLIQLVLNCPYKNKPEENKEKAHLHYGGTVDSWAVGVLAYELLVG